jgi:Tfp pilus assembly protein PilF
MKKTAVISILACLLMFSASLLCAQQTDTAPEEKIDLQSFMSYEACLNTGFEYFENQKYFTALPLFERALKFKRTDAIANYYIGYTYLATDDLDKATMFLKIAIAIDPGFALAYLRLGDVLQKRGDTTGAWEKYKIAYDLNPALISERKVVF